MRLLGVAAAGLALAIAAESVTYLPEDPGLAAADATVGLAFIGLGAIAWQRRPSSRSGLLMAATGVAWFAGSFAGAALFMDVLVRSDGITHGVYDHEEFDQAIRE